MMCTKKVPLIQALRICSLSFFNNKNGEFVIRDENTKTLFATLVDNRQLLADKLEKYEQLQAELKEEKKLTEAVVFEMNSDIMKLQAERDQAAELLKTALRYIDCTSEHESKLITSIHTFLQARKGGE